MNGTAVSGERVVIVEVQSGRVNLKTGRISNDGSDGVDAVHRDEAVVWGDRQLRPGAGSPDEAHERAFRVDDIHLLKEQEAQSLQDPDMAQAWFGTIYQDPLVTKIYRALKRLLRK